jgi:hypothetical protein
MEHIDKHNFEERRVADIDTQESQAIGCSVSA